MWPPYGTEDFCKYLQEHLECLPATSLPTFLETDVNAGISWINQRHEEFVPCGKDCKGRNLLELLMSQGVNLQPPRGEQQHQPTSRPRREGVQGRIIYWTVVLAPPISSLIHVFS